MLNILTLIYQRSIKGVFTKKLKETISYLDKHQYWQYINRQKQLHCVSFTAIELYLHKKLLRSKSFYTHFQTKNEIHTCT